MKEKKGKVGTGRQGGREEAFEIKRLINNFRAFGEASEAQVGGARWRRPWVVLRESRYSGELGRKVKVKCGGAGGE